MKVYFEGETFAAQAPCSGTVEDLAAVIALRTGLPADQQIILAEGTCLPLELEQTLESCALREGETLMVMGCEEVAGDPNQKLDERQLQILELQASQKHPVGMKNGMNFCYLIAALQTLYGIPAARQQLASYNGDDELLLKIRGQFQHFDNFDVAPADQIATAFVQKFQ